MSRISIGAAVVLLMSLLAIGQVQQAAVPSPSQTPMGTPAPSTTDPWFSQRHPRYQIRPGDIFDVSFEYTPEFNQTVTVQPDGYVEMRSVGDLYVAGQTVSQVDESLRAAYSKTLNHPMISVMLKDFEHPYFVADGQVGHPGKYELRDDTTVVQAIAMAGGFLASAKHSQVVLYRRVSDQWTQARLINVKKMQNDRNLSEDIHLQPGDMLFVPKNTISKMMPFIPNSNVSMLPIW